MKIYLEIVKTFLETNLIEKNVSLNNFMVFNF